MKQIKHITKRMAACGLSLFLSLACIAGAGTTLTVSAHSGRTDAYGGHHDYKNKSGLGSYHYHHGYPAHLHEGGICPYDVPSEPVSQPQLPPQPAVPVIPEVPETPSVEASAPAVDYTLVFDAAFYAAANPDVAAVYGTDAALLFQHFLTAGMQEGRQGCADFNVWTYQASNPDLVPVFGSDLAAYYTHYCMTNS